MEPGQKVYYHIVETFGSGILRGDQSIDRQKLGKLVFDDQEKLVKLNSLVHPAVKEYIASEIEKERKEGKVLSWRWKPPFSSKTITIRSVMSSGTFTRMRMRVEDVWPPPWIHQRKIGFHHEKSASGRDFSRVLSICN